MPLRNAATLGLASAVLTACGGPSARPDTASPAADHEHKHGHHHRFDDASRWSKVFDDPARDAWQMPEKVVVLLRIDPGMNVADIGAGTGYFEPHLSRAVTASGSVLAIDVEPNMVQWMTERFAREGLKNVVARLGAPDDPKLDAGVSRVLVVDTWHHIDNRDVYAKKIAKALTAGGALFVVDFTKESPHGPPPAMRLPPELVARELEGAGLVVKTHLPAATGLPNQYIVEGVKPAP